MATTLALVMEATILDELGVKARAFAYALVNPANTFSDIATFFNSWLADLDALTDGQIIDASYEVLPGLPSGLKSSPASGSRVEQTGILDFLDATSGHRWGAAIPALSNSTSVISGGKIVLTSGSPADTLKTLLLTGGAVLEWSNANQQALISFSDALITFRKHSKQLSRLTWEEI